MKMRSLVAPAAFLQAVIVLMGIGALAFMLWEPHLEGRNAHATPFEIYFEDPFLAYVYLGSVPFFAGLHQAIKALGYVRQGRVISHAAVSALRNMKYCAFISAGTIAAGVAILLVAARSTHEDAAGAAMLGFIATFGSIVAGTTAMMFERILQGVVDGGTGNDSRA